MSRTTIRRRRDDAPWAPTSCTAAGLARSQLAVLRGAALVTRPPRHKGFGTIVSVLGRHVFPAGTTATFGFGDGRAVPVALADRYWMRLLLPSWRYEPDTEWVLRRALGPDVLFVDAGANIGWWGALGASLCGTGRVVAIEASGATAERLRATAAANGDAFVALHRAVWDRSGVDLALDFDADRHGRASVHVTAIPVAARRGVTSITIDDVVAEHRGDAERVVVKLDVEGAEVAALRGAARAIADGALLVYEDHGRDDQHQVTRHLLEEVGVDVAWIDPAGGRIEDIHRVEDLDARKVLAWKGYNLVAGDLRVLR